MKNSHAFFKDIYFSRIYSLCCWSTSMHVLQKLPMPALIINSTNQICLGVALGYLQCYWLVLQVKLCMWQVICSLSNCDSPAFLFPSFSCNSLILFFSWLKFPLLCHCNFAIISHRSFKFIYIFSNQIHS